MEKNVKPINNKVINEEARNKLHEDFFDSCRKNKDGTFTCTVWDKANPKDNHDSDIKIHSFTRTKR